MFMNDYEIDEALDVAKRRAPEVARYVQFLSDWKDTVNSNSDGWAHWQAGRKSADRLVALTDRLMTALREGGERPTAAEFEKTLQPIRARATRHGFTAPTLGAAPDLEAAKTGPVDKVYEVTLAGFDGSDDATDHLVVWVHGPEDDVRALIQGTRSTLHGEVDNGAEDADFHLPADADAFLERIADHERKLAPPSAPDMRS